MPDKGNPGPEPLSCRIAVRPSTLDLLRKYRAMFAFRSYDDLLLAILASVNPNKLSKEMAASMVDYWRSKLVPKHAAEERKD